MSFGLSYLSRFLWDIYLAGYFYDLDEYTDDDFTFESEMAFNTVMYIDVLPFIGLLIVHHKNFKQTKVTPCLGEKQLMIFLVKI